MAPRIVTLDIETAPLEVFTWGIWEQNVALNQIKSDWTILSFSAKWLDEKTVAFHSTGGRGAGKVRDDKALLQKLWKLLDEADIVVAQNGAEFDLKKINARLIASGFGPYSPVRVVDTMLAAKRRFGFTSNKLEFLTNKLTNTKKSGHKKFPGFELWAACLRDDKAAWREMAAYNKIDVLSTEELYLKLRPWIDGHPNLAAYSDGDTVHCPKCNSAKLQRRGTQVKQTGTFPRFQCQDCGGWSQGKKSLSTTAKRQSLLGN